MGKRYNAPNDLSIDLKGRIYFTYPRYLGDEPRELEYRAVYRLDKDGTVVEVTHDCAKPNGIVLSPDGKTLYVADHDNGTDKIDPKAPPPKKGAMKLYAFPLGDDGLIDGPRRTLIDFGKEKELPARELITEMLAWFVDDVVDELGSRQEVEYAFRIMRDGTSADRQLAAFERTGDLKAVVDQLIAETAEGIPAAQELANVRMPDHAPPPVTRGSFTSPSIEHRA